MDKQQAIQNLAETSLVKARRLKEKGNISDAYVHYTFVIELCPEKRSEVEEEFTDVLCRWGKIAEKNSIKNTFECYLRSLDVYPKNFRILNNCAGHYLRQNLPRLSVSYLKRALDVNPDFLPAEWNLDYAHNLLIARWHFPMLNDKQRNSRFDRAIRKKIAQGYDTVLDIGTGTGLLSLYAHDAGAKKIYACECSKEMSKIARQVIANNSTNDIQFFNQHSKNLKIPDNLSHKVKLLVTETFDAALFGESILSTLIHAHENLLDTTGIVVPMSASIFISAVESKHIRFTSTVDYFRKDLKSFTFLNFNGIKIFSYDKSYDSTKLDKEKTIFLTEPHEILKINFNDLKELKYFNKNGVKNIIKTYCKHDGIIDGLITWFKLNVDEENVLDTSDEESCWEYAFFPAKSQECSAGEILKIFVTLQNENIKCSFTTNSPKKKINDHENSFCIPQNVVSFLNDTEYISSITRVAQSHKKKSIQYILDTCPFPIYGLESLRINPRIKALYCLVATQKLCKLIEKVAEASKIRKEKIFFVSNIRQIDIPLDVIYNHNFTTQGEIDDWSEPSLHETLNSMLSLKGFMLPKHIFLMGQLGYSPDIPKLVLVDDQNLQRSCNSSNYVIGKFVNEYACKQRFDLKVNLYQFEAMSDCRLLVKIDEGATIKSIVNFGKFTENCEKKIPNVLVTWYSINLGDKSDKISSRRENSFMNHSAIVFEDELIEYVNRECEIKFNILMMNGLFRITLPKFDD